MNPIIQKTFKSGLMTRVEGKDLPRGSSVDCLNWHFLGDHVELRRGRKLLGSEIPDTGRISGMKVLRKFNGDQIIIYSYARKLMYYDPTTDTHTEIDTDVLPSAVLGTDGIGEDISIEQYNSLAGNFAYLTSPNSSFYKIPVANPTSIVDLLSKEYKGRIHIKNSSCFLWDRKDTFGGSDRTGIYRSYVDQTTNSYLYNSKEVIGTGDGTTQLFSGTLAFKASQSKETCFFIVIAGAKSAGTSISAITTATSASITSGSHGLSVGDTVIINSVVGMTEINGLIAVVLSTPDLNTFTVNIDSTDFTAYSSGGLAYKSERFIDDKSGVLTGQDGGTGTINYATGAFSVSFNLAPTNLVPIYAQYYRENSTTSGIADFTYDDPRTIGQGSVFRQDDGGGKFMAIESLGSSEYCLHEFKTWILTINSPDDTTGTTNLIFRDNVGIPYQKAAKATGDGIFYIDSIGENPAIRVLDYTRFINQVLPRSVSSQLNLNAYKFEKAVMFEWGDYIILACREEKETINNRLFLYHKLWKTWEIHSLRASCLDILNGALIAGDSGSNNIFKLFSGLTDEEALIENYIIFADDDLNKEGIKKVNIVRFAGYIGIDQGMKISYSLDDEPFVEIGGTDEVVDGITIHHPILEGSGSYVDLTQRKLIGSETLGEDMVGGGQSQDSDINASPYAIQFHVGTKKFEAIKIKCEATATGYLSISEYGFVDIRDKGLKQPQKYIV